MYSWRGRNIVLCWLYKWHFSAAIEEVHVSNFGVRSFILLMQQGREFAPGSLFQTVGRKIHSLARFYVLCRPWPNSRNVISWLQFAGFLEQGLIANPKRPCYLLNSMRDLGYAELLQNLRYCPSSWFVWVPFFVGPFFFFEAFVITLCLNTPWRQVKSLYFILHVEESGPLYVTA